MEGQAESYNDLWWDSNKVETFRLFLDKNPSVGRHFDRKIVNIDMDVRRVERVCFLVCMSCTGKVCPRSRFFTVDQI